MSTGMAPSIKRGGKVTRGRRRGREGMKGEENRERRGKKRGGVVREEERVGREEDKRRGEDLINEWL